MPQAPATSSTSDPTSPYFGYACPQSNVPLEVLPNGSLKSLRSGCTYAVKNGVPNFLAYPPTETADAVAAYRKLLELARGEGCETALRQLDAEAGYVLDESRAKYLDLLPLTTESRVLEIGASKGQHSRLIAKRCGQLHSLDVVLEQALFGSLWCSQLGCSSVAFAAGGDDCRLPYFSGIFDVVILNYVFEWCGSRAENPSMAQQRLLQECQRVLAPGGCLFLSTKNRYSARLLTGAVDEHVRMRFGNALPRWAMRAALKLTNRPRPQGILYSYRQLKGLLTNSGFGRIESYWAIPDGRYPLEYIPHDPSSLATARSNSRLSNVDKLTSRFLKSAPLTAVRWLAPSHVFMAHKA